LVTWTNAAQFSDPINIEIIDSVSAFNFDLSTKTTNKRVGLDFSDLERNYAANCTVAGIVLIY
jgi:hypothetical protein